MPEPDYFDRLLARQGGAVAGGAGGGAAGGGGAVAGWARPRLPGPFERAEPSRNEAPEPPPAAPLPSYPKPDLEWAPQPSPLQVRVERHTEVRTETAAPEPAVPAHTPMPAVDRWFTRVVPRHQPGAQPQPDRASHQVTPAAPRGEAPARPAAIRVGPDHAPAAQAMPRRDQTAEVRRNAVPPQASRRRARPAEPAVHVRIGRLEVRATGAAPAPTRSVRPGRQDPAVSLTDYLTGGRRP
ncbi:hypothetical protein [Actinoplanes sp. GCM10030250]|uniref:hypothetical protein n=1 Tax=Actinoplanes sp. GCM10030250 TaxID=3273376 RepID=UPI00361DCC4A